MAVTITMTGTARSCTLTSGSNSIVVSSANAIGLELIQTGGVTNPEAE